MGFSIYRPLSFCSRELHFFLREAFAPANVTFVSLQNIKTGKPHRCSRFHAHPPSLPALPLISLTNSLYPVATGKVAILRTIAPNSRRVSWLSASSSQ